MMTYAKTVGRGNTMIITIVKVINTLASSTRESFLPCNAPAKCFSMV